MTIFMDEPIPVNRDSDHYGDRICVYICHGCSLNIGIKENLILKIYKFRLVYVAILY